MKLILAIVGVICIGIGALIFSLLIKPSLDAKKILENGAETTATLIDFGSNMSSDEAYYWLKLSFVNSEGETITCKTKSLYPQSYIRGQGIAEYHRNTKKYELTEEPVLVMYMGDKAVLKEFFPENAGWATWIIPCFFGGFGVLILLGFVLAPIVGMFPVIQQLLALIGLMLVGFVFAGVGAGVYFWVLKPPMEAAKILKNGVETTATVVNIGGKITTTTKTNTSSRTDVYYYLTLSYVNSKGEEVIYKTKSIYSENFIKNKIADNKTVQVIYRDNKAVVKDFVPEKTETFLWIFPIVFGAIGIAFWIFLAFGIVKSANEYNIKKHGAESTGIYVKHEYMKITTAKGETEAPACNIYFTYENQHGEIVEAQTGYLSYQVHEAEALAAMRIFPIKYKGKKAIIMVDRKELEKKE